MRIFVFKQLAKEAFACEQKEEKLVSSLKYWEMAGMAKWAGRCPTLLTERRVLDKFLN